MKLGTMSVALSAVLMSCGRAEIESDIESQITRDGIDITVASTDSEFNYHFDHMTPTGKKLFEAAQVWEKTQWSFRNTAEARRVLATPEARMCAGNLSQVYYMTGLRAFKNNYRWTAVDEVSSGIGDHGGRVINFSKNKQSLIKQLNAVYGGRIPLGSVAGGCLEMDRRGNCRRIDGSRHIGMVGHTVDLGISGGVATEVVMTYHNNWYRMENASGQYHKFMVSKRNQRAGFPRQFMAVPWIEIDRDIATKEIVDIRTAVINPTTGIAAVDDMDPFTYNAFIAIPKEIEADIAAGKSQTTDGIGSVNALGEIDYDKVDEGNFCYTASDPAGTDVIVRDRPDGDQVAVTTDGEKLKILGRSGDFLRVETQGVTGFVSGNQFAPCKFLK
jgi:hypothetical protein